MGDPFFFEKKSRFYLKRKMRCIFIVVNNKRPLRDTKCFLKSITTSRCLPIFIIIIDITINTVLSEYPEEGPKVLV